MARRTPPKPLALALVIAAAFPGCTQPDPHASASPPASLPASSSSPSVPPSVPSAVPSSVPSFAPAAAPSKRACGATHLVVAGETLAAIATACYGSRAYDDLLGRKNALKGSTLRIGKSLATPPLRDLARCAPAEVCEPIYAAHASFLEAQAFTEASKDKAAPPAAQRHLEAAARSLDVALQAAEAKKITRPRNQLKGALAEIAELRAGSYGERGYPEHVFHQHLVFALEALGAGS
jgi:hypothetical protein